MQRLRRAIRQEDIFWWVDTFLRAGGVLQQDQGDLPPSGELLTPVTASLTSPWR
jgi:hypothetical protein